MAKLKILKSISVKMLIIPTILALNMIFLAAVYWGTMNPILENIKMMGSLLEPTARLTNELEYNIHEIDSLIYKFRLYADEQIVSDISKLNKNGFKLIDDIKELVKIDEKYKQNLSDLEKNYKNYSIYFKENMIEHKKEYSKIENEILNINSRSYLTKQI